MHPGDAQNPAAADAAHAVQLPPAQCPCVALAKHAHVPTSPHAPRSHVASHAARRASTTAASVEANVTHPAPSKPAAHASQRAPAQNPLVASLAHSHV